MPGEDDQQQQSLTGEIVSNRGEDDDELDLDDYGRERPYWRSKGGYRRDLLSSLAQKSARRSQEEITFAIWEMIRSGYGSHAWNRLVLYLVEDIAAGEHAVLTVPGLERIARDAGVNSHVSQIAGIKAARLSANARSSREGVHLDDYFRHVAELQTEYDDPPYEFPIQPEITEAKRNPRPPSGSQMKFVDDGDLQPDFPTSRFGEELHEGRTYGGFNHERLSSELESAILDGDVELAGFAAWELVRSGYQEIYWDRIAELGAIYAPVESQVTALIDQYHALATDRWTSEEWEGRISSILAAITLIRAGPSTACADRCEKLRKLAEARANGNAEFPVETDELALNGRYDVCADRHSRPGAGWAGRGWKHFWIHAARCGPEGEPVHSREAQRKRLQMEVDYFRDKFSSLSEAQIDHALTPVDFDQPWHEDRIAPDSDLDEWL